MKLQKLDDGPTAQTKLLCLKPARRIKIVTPLQVAEAAMQLVIRVGHAHVEFLIQKISLITDY